MIKSQRLHTLFFCDADFLFRGIVIHVMENTQQGRKRIALTLPIIINTAYHYLGWPLFALSNPSTNLCMGQTPLFDNAKIWGAPVMAIVPFGKLCEFIVF